VRLEREGDGRTLLVENLTNGTVSIAHLDGDEEHFVLLDSSELRWLVTAALPAILAAT
jgi:hypothetical protein